MDAKIPASVNACAKAATFPSRVVTSPSNVSKDVATFVYGTLATVMNALEAVTELFSTIAPLLSMVQRVLESAAFLMFKALVVLLTFLILSVLVASVVLILSVVGILVVLPKALTVFSRFDVLLVNWDTRYSNR